VQTCIWPSWCHCHSLSLARVKSRLVLPFWYRLTQVVPEKGPLSGCVCVSTWKLDSACGTCNHTQCTALISHYNQTYLPLQQLSVISLYPNRLSVNWCSNHWLSDTNCNNQWLLTVIKTQCRDCDGSFLLAVKNGPSIAHCVHSSIRKDRQCIIGGCTWKSDIITAQHLHKRGLGRAGLIRWVADHAATISWLAWKCLFSSCFGQVWRMLPLKGEEQSKQNPDLFGRDRDETKTLETVSETRPRRDVVSPRRDWDRDVTSCRDVWWKAVSTEQSPQVAAYRDNWSGIRANHVAFIIWAFYGLVNAAVGLPYVILVSVMY